MADKEYRDTHGYTTKTTSIALQEAQRQLAEYQSNLTPEESASINASKSAEVQDRIARHKEYLTNRPASEEVPDLLSRATFTKTKIAPKGMRKNRFPNVMP